jgi:GNAT superfamily N-acetyltransferase
MIDPYLFAAALADERHKELMAQAEQYRLARQARRPRTHRAHRLVTWLRAEFAKGQLLSSRSGELPQPSLVAWANEVAPATGLKGRPVRLGDGSTVLVRPVDGTDAQLLSAGFERLSPASRRTRFLYPKQALSPSEVRYLTEVDHHDHEALGAVAEADGRGVGVARYIRDPHDPCSAEVAVTVIDDWHRRGVGTELLTQLVRRASEEGISRFTALIAADNPAPLGLLRKLDLDVELSGYGDDALEYKIELTEAASTRAGRIPAPCS